MKKLLTLNLLLSLLAIWLTVGGGLPEALKAEAAKINPVKKIDKTATVSSTGTVSPSTAVINWADLSIFYNYLSWPHSINKKADDTWPQFIVELRGPPTGFPSYDTYSMTDVNGDGLMDMIYHWEFNGWDGANNIVEQMAVWLNKGNNSFQLMYKCYMADSQGWYGDCAAV